MHVKLARPLWFLKYHQRSETLCDVTTTYELLTKTESVVSVGIDESRSVAGAGGKRDERSMPTIRYEAMLGRPAERAKAERSRPRWLLNPSENTANDGEERRTERRANIPQCHVIYCTATPNFSSPRPSPLRRLSFSNHNTTVILRTC